MTPEQAVFDRLTREAGRRLTIEELRWPTSEELRWSCPVRMARREVEAAILALRLAGEPICSDGSGVWLGTPDELAACIERLRARARTQLVTCRALRRTLRRMEGQMVLWRLAG